VTPPQPVRKIAVLDDYQDVARSHADWSRLPAGAELSVFTEFLGGPDDVVAALEPFDVAVAMRERTAFPAEVLERLPNLRLLVTTGPANVATVGVDGLTPPVTVHLKLSERTTGLLGRDDLARMKPTALLVNTSRGPIVDEDALLDALRDGTIGGAALDVFGTEPLPADHPLRTAPRTVLTPHLGYVTEGSYEVFYGDAVEDIAAFAAGAPVRVFGPDDGA
jgi:phosphoglycerate dehydrogenase-like enzyme